MNSEQIEAAEQIMSDLMERFDTAKAKEVAAYVAGYFAGREDAEEFAAEQAA